jgi:hypothetical protein
MFHRQLYSPSEFLLQEIYERHYYCTTFYSPVESCVLLWCVFINIALYIWLTCVFVKSYLKLFRNDILLYNLYNLSNTYIYTTHALSPKG